MTVSETPPGRRSFGRTAGIVIPLAVVAAVVAAALTRPAQGGSARVDLFPVDAREAAPTDPQPLLLGDGTLSLRSLRGEIVVVNFWASWCGPCRREQPELNRAHRRLARQGVAFVGVDVRDSDANGAAHWREFDVPYDSVVDQQASFSADFDGVSPAALPTTILLDTRGRVAVRIFGETTVAELTDLVQQLRAETAAARDRDGQPLGSGSSSRAHELMQ